MMKMYIHVVILFEIKIRKNINKFVLHVFSIKLRDKIHFSFSIPTPDFPHFYYMLRASLGLLYTEKFP